MSGDVEVDDTWVGGTQAGLRGSRQLKGRKAALVLVAVEKRGPKILRGGAFPGKDPIARLALAAP
jgi:hypothetical protein